MWRPIRAHEKPGCLLFAFLILANLLYYVDGTEVCPECRPLDLQEAPAVGLALAPGYGSLSLQYINGTIFDAAFIQGSEAYVKAMKFRARPDTIPSNISNEENTKLPIENESNDKAVQNKLWSWLPRILHFTSGYRRNSKPSLEPINEVFVPIVEMIQNLFKTANESGSLRYNAVYLTGAYLSIRSQASVSPPSMQHLLGAAGLSGLGSLDLNAMSSLHLYDLTSCFGIELENHTYIPDVECESYQGRRIRSVFGMQLDKSALEFDLSVRDDDGCFTFGSSKLLWKDEHVSKQSEYWPWVEDELRGYLEDEGVKFDLLKLSGTEVTAPELQKIIQRVFKKNKDILPKDYLRSAQDHTFAAARGAAKMARPRMCTESLCIPNSWCQISKGCKNYYLMDVEEEGRSEL